jgi:uncharacterized membrane protein
MHTTAEKTNHSTTAVQQKAQQQPAFFRKAGDEPFFGANEQPAFFSAPVQAKLSISSPDDPQEKEADAVADKVMRMPEPAAAVPVVKKEEEKINPQKETVQPKPQAEPLAREVPLINSVQRKEEKEKEEIQPKLQRKEDKEEEVQTKLFRKGDEEEMVQPQLQRKEDKEATLQPKLFRKAEKETEEKVQPKLMAKAERPDAIAGNAEEHAGTGTVGITSGYINCKNIGLYRSDTIQRSGRGPPTGQIPLTQSLASSKGGGSALPSDTRQFMESRINADFSGVRIHTGSQAEGMSRSINAQAFAHGNDIYFNEGKYAPHTEAGGTLLAHELTHTIQQGASRQSGDNKVNRRLNPDAPKTVNQDKASSANNKTPINARETNNRAIQKPAKAALQPPANAKTLLGQSAKTDKGSPTAAVDKNKAQKQPSKKKQNISKKPSSHKPIQNKKKKDKPKAVPKRGGQHKKSLKGKAPSQGTKGKKNRALKKRPQRKPLNIKINPSELRGKAPLAVVSRHKRSQQVINTISNKSVAAKENFAGQLSDKTVFIQNRLNSQMESVAQTGNEQEIQLKAIFSSAKAKATSAISDSSERLSSHGKGQEASLSGAQTSSGENVNTIFTTGQDRVNNITNLYAGRSLEVANNAANQFQTNVQDAVNQTVEITNSKASVGGSDADVAEAKREAANQVGSDTTNKVSEGLTEGMNGLIASGPETSAEFTRQGAEAASQLMAGKTEVDTQINQVFTNAIPGVSQMTDGAVKSIQQQKDPILTQFTAQEDDVIGQLVQHVEQKMGDFQQAGEQIMLAFKQQAMQSFTVADNQTNTISHQISTVNVAEKDLPSVQSFAEQDVSHAYNGLTVNLNQGAQSLEGEINQKGTQVVGGLQTISNPVSTKVKTATSQISTSILQSEQQHTNQITDSTNQAIGGANSVIAQVSTGLTQQIGSIDTQFQQGLDGYNTILLQQVSEGTDRAREPVNTLPSRTDQAQQKAVDRASKSWLENQWDDFVEIVSDPGFWAGLLLGILLVALVIFFEVITLGTATVVIVAIAAAIGGIAAGVGSIVGQAMNHSFTGGWDSSRIKWGEVGKAILLGAAAGAVFALVGVFAVGSLGLAATGFAMIGVMSVTSGIVGIITNVINGQPWDKGLLFNLALGGLLTWLMGKIPTRTGRNTPPTEDPTPGKGETPDPLPVPATTDPIPVEQQNIRASSPNKGGGTVEWTLYDEASGATFAWQEVEVNAAGVPEGGPHQTLLPKEASLPDGTTVVLKAKGFSWTDVSIRMMMETFEKIFGMKAPNLSGAIAWENLKNFQGEFAKIKSANPALSEQEIGNQAIRGISYGRARIQAGYGKLSVDIFGKTTYTLPNGTVVEVPSSVYVNALPD